MKKIILALMLSAISTMAYGSPITTSADPSLAGGTVIDFESQSLGSFSSLTIGNVVFSGNLTLSNDSNGMYVPPASVFLDNRSGGDFTFDFISNVSAFGLKVGATNDTQYLRAYDSSNNLLETVVIPDQVSTSPFPYTGFYGISLGSDLISKVVLTGNNADWIVTDDFTYKSGGESTPVPEPGTMMLLGIGIAGLAIYGKRRQG